MKMEQVDDGLLNHVGNLLECMRTRKTPQTDIEYGHRSSSACLLGNVALRTKERLEWDVANQKLIKGGPAAQKLLEPRIPRALEADGVIESKVEGRRLTVVRAGLALLRESADGRYGGRRYQGPVEGTICSPFDSWAFLCPPSISNCFE